MRTAMVMSKRCDVCGGNVVLINEIAGVRVQAPYYMCETCKAVYLPNGTRNMAYPSLYDGNNAAFDALHQRLTGMIAQPYQIPLPPGQDPAALRLIRANYQANGPCQVMHHGRWQNAVALDYYPSDRQLYAQVPGITPCWYNRNEHCSSLQSLPLAVLAPPSAADLAKSKSADRASLRKHGLCDTVAVNVLVEGFWQQAKPVSMSDIGVLTARLPNGHVVFLKQGYWAPLVPVQVAKTPLPPYVAPLIPGKAPALQVTAGTSIEVFWRKRWQTAIVHSTDSSGAIIADMTRGVLREFKAKDWRFAPVKPLLAAAPAKTGLALGKVRVWTYQLAGKKKVPICTEIDATDTTVCMVSDIRVGDLCIRALAYRNGYRNCWHIFSAMSGALLCTASEYLAAEAALRASIAAADPKSLLKKLEESKAVGAKAVAVSVTTFFDREFGA